MPSEQKKWVRNRLEWSGTFHQSITGLLLRANLTEISLRPSFKLTREIPENNPFAIKTTATGPESIFNLYKKFIDKLNIPTYIKINTKRKIFRSYIDASRL